MNIQDQALNFLDKIFSHISKEKIVIKNWEIDHLCYRTSSEENYQLIKKQFEGISTCLIESEVNGRLIATYKLNNPIYYKDWIIDLVEVPAPKPYKETIEGFEHIEVVIDESFEFILEKYPNANFSKKGMDKVLNPELEIEFEDCAIKFHHKSLEHIINIEKNNLVMKLLNESRILDLLADYTPLLSGTIPLNIYTKESDLDILCQSKDLNIFEEHINNVFPDSKIVKTKHQDKDSLVVNFNYNGLAIEIFCQDLSVFKQQANQHFLIEGRLLKILGQEFSQKIKDLKSNGYKTEPAFGMALNLTNPYEDLINLNKLSDLEIYKRFK